MMGSGRTQSVNDVVYMTHDDLGLRSNERTGTFELCVDMNVDMDCDAD